ncbi:hypothetical protein RQM59_11400 [Flavobacteriaceae bacterium S356]|uniref:Uncharacterized protein n=1 Tax=Asprobacillus argus TaxID=3076534 RepID=A0ABU3LGY6_9FLAO|nr:hypothetical protein [Flavobacteriaceae bacterium S356]
MKKGILLLAGLLLLTVNTEAKSTENPVKKIGFSTKYYNSVSFVERGIQFDVFLNGDFDFEAIRRNYRYNNRRNRHSRIRISRDYKGRINKVGNVSIRYDHRGNVRRIGSIFIQYRRGRLSNVGNLKVRYNRWGDPRFYGEVKYQYSYSPGFVYDYNDVYFYRNEFRNNYRLYKQDANFYYYRANRSAKVSRNKLLKRRKQTVVKKKPVKRVVKKAKRRSKRS